MQPAYLYRMRIERWVDGDTFDAQVDLGFHVGAQIRFRLLGVDTPERGQPGFVKARELAEKVLPPGSVLVTQTLKSEKYGRWLIDVPQVRQALEVTGLTKAAATVTATLAATPAEPLKGPD